MKLMIYKESNNAATMTLTTTTQYLEACRLIDSCIARGISVGVATKNPVIEGWLVAQYENRCDIEMEVAPMPAPAVDEMKLYRFNGVIYLSEDAARRAALDYARKEYGAHELALDPELSRTAHFIRFIMLDSTGAEMLETPAAGHTRRYAVITETIAVEILPLRFTTAEASAFIDTLTTYCIEGGE